ncbi:APC family permease [Pseudonocardia endophytica]|uniref:Amino acid/polyamine/organocation transporter (APC superfamily) n=1 Tax=Pseudonocardia endophytica TaxID=401976 RepID=A0A4R1HSI7_PSEEN|nr:APC family permease [Pseudonocardia endophytica]TCK25138.1 amino acid/polyamine/organocation transporter (APC superfamily) [Pseudonocardia endophytica]
MASVPSARTQAPQLRRRRLGVVHLVFFTVAASAPLTVLAGGVTTTYAVSGNAGVPLAFLGLAVVLGLFAIGYGAMSRFVANAGAFYSYLSLGLGRGAGVGGSFVALISYNAIQIGLYGLFGATASDFVAEAVGLRLPWWTWAFLALIVVGALGLLRVDLNARVLAVLLIIEVIVVIAYDVAAFREPAGGAVTFAPLTPSTLLVPGVGAVIAFNIAAFTGFESGAIYSEETRNPGRTVARATFVAVAFTGLFYALSSWAMVAQVGTENLQQAATENGPGLVFGPLADHYGVIVSDVATVLFLTSVFAALLSFHNGVARYLFALGRERVLPSGLSAVGTRSGGPVAGSITQSVVAVIVVLVFVVLGLDPVLTLFTWFSGMSAIGVVLLMASTSAAVVGYFARERAKRTEASLWARAIAPAIASVLLFVLLVVLVGNFDALLGTDPSSPLRWILPVLVLLAALGGVVWATVLRRTRPMIYSGIGRSTMPEESGASAEPERAPKPYLREHDTEVTTKIDRLS